MTLLSDHSPMSRQSNQPSYATIESIVSDTLQTIMEEWSQVRLSGLSKILLGQSRASPFERNLAEIWRVLLFHDLESKSMVAGIWFKRQYIALTSKSHFVQASCQASHSSGIKILNKTASVLKKVITITIKSNSGSTSASASGHLLICSSAHLLICSSAHLLSISISVSMRSNQHQNQRRHQHQLICETKFNPYKLWGAISIKMSQSNQG